MKDTATDGYLDMAIGSRSMIAATRIARQVDVLLHERRQQMIEALDRFNERRDELTRIASLLVATLQMGGKVLIAGNGGSAAEAQHFAGELVGRFLMERRPYAAMALCVDSAVVTAIANDYGYDDVFARQVEALGCPGDLLIAISTSGTSRNLLRAAEAARSQKMRVVAITGDRPNPLEALALHSLRVPSSNTPIIQELQMMVTHVLCGIAETELTRPLADEEPV